MSNDYGLTFRVATTARATASRTLITWAVNLVFRQFPSSAVTYTSVLVVGNRVGRSRALADVSALSKEEVHERIDEIERDLKVLSLPEWCERYGVPSSFVEESDPDSGPVAPEPGVSMVRSDVEYDLHNWSPVDILNALTELKQQQIPYVWDDEAQVLGVSAGDEAAASRVVLGDE